MYVLLTAVLIYTTQSKGVLVMEYINICAHLSTLATLEDSVNKLLGLSASICWCDYIYFYTNTMNIHIAKIYSRLIDSIPIHSMFHSILCSMFPWLVASYSYTYMQL